MTQQQQDVRVKIYKAATQKSILDILSALDYHKENNNKEQVYKGNIVILINEYGASKNTEKAFVTKAGAKNLFNAIKNNRFKEYFPNGFVEYGGSSNNGKITARVIKVQMTDRNQYIFTIETGQGVLEGNGAIKLVKTEKKVQSYVAFEEAVKMGYEVTDYIHHAELISVIKKKPFFTILPEFIQNQK